MRYITCATLHCLRVWYDRNVNNTYAYVLSHCARGVVSDGSSAVVHDCQWRKKTDHTSLGMWGVIQLHSSKLSSFQC